MLEQSQIDLPTGTDSAVGIWNITLAYCAVFEWTRLIPYYLKSRLLPLRSENLVLAIFLRITSWPSAHPILPEYVIAIEPINATKTNLIKASFLLLPLIRNMVSTKLFTNVRSFPSRSKLGFNLLIIRNVLSLLPYGGYLTPRSLSIQPGVVTTERRWVKVSKDALPRYEPCPESPTPPKARVGIEPWK